MQGRSETGLVQRKYDKNKDGPGGIYNPSNREDEKNSSEFLELSNHEVVRLEKDSSEFFEPSWSEMFDKTSTRRREA